MIAGFHALKCDIPILGISVRQPEQVQIENVYNLAVKTAAQLTDKPLPREKVMVDDGYIGEGYGIPTQTMVEATNMLARNEGILLVHPKLVQNPLSLPRLALVQLGYLQALKFCLRLQLVLPRPS